MKLSTFINFPGTCEEAFNFYADLFGLEIKEMKKYRGTPAVDRVPDETWWDKIMHAEIVLDGHLILACDLAPPDYKKPQGIRLKISADSLADGQHYFSTLSDGGETHIPFAPAFWTEGFGMCEDKYGVTWVIDVLPAPDAK